MYSRMYYILALMFLLNGNNEMEGFFEAGDALEILDAHQTYGEKAR